jgi:hypothetical protein
VQLAAGGDPRVELAQAAGGAVARIDHLLLTCLALALDDGVEVLAEHDDFAPHLQDPRRLGGVEPQGNDPDGPDVGCDVFAGSAVASRRGLYQHLVFIGQAHRQAIEFQFRRIFHLGGFQSVPDTLVEGQQFLLAEAIAK